MNELLITIAIPTYNNAKTIENTIESCLNQATNIEYEVLVVNNASQDETKKVIELYDEKKLRVIHNNETLSMYENHNVCLKNASGKYVVFCHSDDVLEKHAIDTLVQKIKERNYPEKYVLWGHSMFRDFSRNIKSNGFLMNEMIVGQYAPSIFMRGGLTPSGTCYSRESFLAHNGFLRTNHQLAPSDMTTMLYLALHRFSFEMLDKMIFIRTDASTLTAETNIVDTLSSLDDAFQQLFQVTNSKQIESLLVLSSNLEPTPYSFYYALAQDSRYKKYIQRKVIRKLATHPLQLRQKVVQKLLLRLIS